MACEQIGSKTRLDCVSPLSDALELMTNRILAIFETVLVLSFLSSSDELFIAVVYILNFQASRFQNLPLPFIFAQGRGCSIIVAYIVPLSTYKFKYKMVWVFHLIRVWQLLLLML